MGIALLLVGIGLLVLSLGMLPARGAGAPALGSEGARPSTGTGAPSPRVANPGEAGPLLPAGLAYLLRHGGGRDPDPR